MSATKYDTLMLAGYSGAEWLRSEQHCNPSRNGERRVSDKRVRTFDPSVGSRRTGRRGEAVSAIEHAARELVAARARRAAAKKALLAYRQEHGGCENNDDEQHDVGDHRGNCYQRYPSLPLDRRCDVCQGSEPLWQARTRAATDVGAAMRRLTRLCNKAVPA